MTARKLPAVLFDMDGTLLDSIELILAGAVFAFEGREGNRPTRDEWRALIGTPLDAMLAKWSSGPEDVLLLRARYRQFQLENHDSYVSLYDGVESALRELHARGHPLGIVSSKLDAGIRRSMDFYKLTPLFDVIVGMDHTAHHKPHPEPVRFALGKLGVAPNDAIFVGDSPHDIESGNAAGVETVGVTWGAFSREEIAHANPNAWIASMPELMPLVDRAR
ncbi:MAG: HAD-IA family hydrolase [Gemmatimonadetes bacterium]|nr:HAD-IA family hydrolase [Gemmatimonadota bacterium]